MSPDEFLDEVAHYRKKVAAIHKTLIHSANNMNASVVASKLIVTIDAEISLLTNKLLANAFGDIAAQRTNFLQIQIISCKLRLAHKVWSIAIANIPQTAVKRFSELISVTADLFDRLNIMYADLKNYPEPYENEFTDIFNFLRDYVLEDFQISFNQFESVLKATANTNGRNHVFAIFHRFSKELAKFISTWQGMVNPQLLVPLQALINALKLLMEGRISSPEKVRYDVMLKVTRDYQHLTFSTNRILEDYLSISTVKERLIYLKKTSVEIASLEKIIICNQEDHSFVKNYCVELLSETVVDTRKLPVSVYFDEVVIQAQSNIKLIKALTGVYLGQSFSTEMLAQYKQELLESLRLAESTFVLIDEGMLIIRDLSFNVMNALLQLDIDKPNLAIFTEENELFGIFDALVNRAQEKSGGQLMAHLSERPAFHKKFISLLLLKLNIINEQENALQQTQSHAMVKSVEQWVQSWLKADPKLEKNNDIGAIKRIISSILDPRDFLTELLAEEALKKKQQPARKKKNQKCHTKKPKNVISTDPARSELKATFFSEKKSMTDIPFRHRVIRAQPQLDHSEGVDPNEGWIEAGKKRRPKKVAPVMPISEKDEPIKEIPRDVHHQNPDELAPEPKPITSKPLNPEASSYVPVAARMSIEDFQRQLAFEYYQIQAYQSFVFFQMKAAAVLNGTEPADFESTNQTFIFNYNDRLN